MKNKVVAITGPTAVGKTQYAIELAERFMGEIVSCDSMQIYKHMDIGSAKPSAKELAAVPHHLIGFVDPAEEYSAARYQKAATEVIDCLLSRNILPVLVGGTGLYLDSVMFDMDFGSGKKDDSFRKSLEEQAEREGTDALYRRLQEVDPDGAERIHPNNVKKVIRAIEAAELYGNPISDFANVAKKKNEKYDVILIGLRRDREELYQRINRRVDILMDMGLLDEVKNLIQMGLDDKTISMKGIGYKELIGYLNGSYGLDEAVRLIKRNTRRFAKRQMTWFGRYEDIKWFDLTDNESALEDMAEWVEKKM